jgi:probable phosphoglycerate mutase
VSAADRTIEVSGAEPPDASVVTRVLLVRHGQSTWNAEGRWQGQADPPLSPLGASQARAAASSAELTGIDAWWSSDLRRAVQTSDLLVGDRGTRQVDPRLRERHAGEWEGLTRAEIEAGWRGFLAAHRRPAGWEDDEPLLERALAALTDIAAATAAERVVVVTHGGVIRALERRFGTDELPVPNLGGRWVEIGSGAVGLGERALLVDVGQVTVPGQI